MFNGQVPTPTKRILSKQRSFSLDYPKLSLYFLISSVTILALLQIHALQLLSPLPSPSLPLQFPLWSHPANGTAVFLPLKDLRFADTPMDGNTWFMSSLNDTYELGETEHLYFPSDTSNNRLLCILGKDASNGTRNFYALARLDSLPPNAKLLPGLTFISDTYYDYENLFHGLTTMSPFVSWHGRKGCVKPDRWVLYHQGELRKRMGTWVTHLVESVFGGDMNIETLEEGGTRPSCFEEAVVFRHNEGKMSSDRKEDVYGMIRCKARAYCNVSAEVEDEKNVRLTLLLRTGSRSFKNETGLIQILDSECKKVDRCRMKVTRPNNLTFCDQVGLMSWTDVLVSSHGAQMTNMFLMDKNSSVMEFFPKGWLEGAGVGQYVFQWIAEWAGLRHKGTWRDPNGEQCPHGDDPIKCFPFYKNSQIAHDEGYLRKWAADVVKEMREYKNDESRRNRQQSFDSCPCT